MGYRFSKYWLLFLFSFFATFIMLSGQNLAGAGEIVGVKIMNKEMIGRYLADAKGMALYHLTKDERKISHCIEGCAINWPPFYIDSSAVIEGLAPEDFTNIKRTDGKLQTTYRGKPLYYFKNDNYPGDTFGQGIGDKWFLITP